MEIGKNFDFPSEDHDAVFVSFTGGKFADKLEVKDSAEQLFTGEVAAWAQRLTRIHGDFVAPRQMYIEWTNNRPHRVAWVEHIGVNRADDTPFHVHHVVCDCAYYDELDLTDGEALVNCDVIQNALIERTGFIARKHNITEVINAYNGVSPDDFKRNDELNDILTGVIEGILVFDKTQPAEWLGNVISGEHDVSLISRIVDQPTDAVRLCADILQLQGKVDMDGDTIRLRRAA